MQSVVAARCSRCAPVGLSETKPQIGREQAGAVDETLPLPHLSLKAVCDYLFAGCALAIAVSTTGDEGSTATVMLGARSGKPARGVVLVDMTGTGCPPA